MPEKRLSKSVVALILVLFVILANYVIIRAFFLVVTPFPLAEKLFGLLFFGAEGFVLLHGFGYFSNMLSNYRRFRPPAVKAYEEEPSVAVLVPARHEPYDVLYSTMLSCVNLSYGNKRVYLLDDSSIASYKEEARAIAEELGVELFVRPDNRGAKAGMLNEVLATLDATYIVVFDADQNPMPGFLGSMVPIMEGDSRLALVQTPQFYSNTAVSRVAWSSMVQQAVFYEYICEGKSAKGAMFCCGTNFIMRREALVSVGGFEEGTVTEDVATTFKLHLSGWKTLYHERAYTFGMAPEDLGSYFTQQNRWALGSAQLLRKLLSSFLHKPSALSFLQWFEYFLSGSYYFIGWAYMILLSAPVLYIFTSVPSYFMEPLYFAVFYIPYFLLSVFLFYFGLGQRNYRTRHLVLAQMLAMLAAPVYMQAVVQGFFNRKKPFQVTPKGGARAIPYRLLSVQLLLWMVHLSAFTWGMMRLVLEQDIGVALNVFWVGFHFMLFSSLFYFNKE